MSKKLFILIILILSVLILTGCHKSYRTDYTKRYNKYLQYSTGGYKVIDKKVLNWRGDLIPAVTYDALEWTIEYKDNNDITQTFTFRNYEYIRGGDDDSNFGYAVLEYAIPIGSKEVGQKLCSKYFPLYSHEDSNAMEELDTYVKSGCEPRRELEKSSFYASCINLKSGINFRNITAKELSDKWHCNFVPYITTKTTDEVKLKEIIYKTESLMLDYINYFNKDNLTAKISGVDKKHSYKITYDKITDTFSVITTEQEEYEYNYPDGHLRYISTFIINGKELHCLKGATYNKETKQYYIGDYIRALEFLNITVEKIDYNKYKWQIGNDRFEACKAKPFYIKMNGGNNLLKYDTDKHGITSLDFELISGATVRIDEIKEAIIIESKK